MDFANNLIQEQVRNIAHMQFLMIVIYYTQFFVIATLLHAVANNCYILLAFVALQACDCAFH